MSDYKDNPPPDDFSKTTPNINIPANAKENEAPNDWDKTNYNFPKQPPADDWGKTIANLKPIDTSQRDLGKTMYPGASNAPETGWETGGKSEAGADFGTSPDDFGAVNNKTTPYFKLPEAERAKYQNLPPTPTEQATIEQQEQKAKGGIPGWVWILGGLSIMFFFTLLALGIIWYFIMRPTNFEIVVLSAPPGSEIRIDNLSWSLPESDGSYRIPNVRIGSRNVTIIHPTQKCDSLPVQGMAGDVKKVVARCEPVKAAPGEICDVIAIGEEEKAERCYYSALGALPENFTADQLVKALNLLIINFASGSFEIPAHRQAALNRGALFIKKLPPNILLEVGGHTDNRGSDADNQKLSENRANAVKQYLTTQGVLDGALQTRGYGASQPRPGVDNNTDQGRFLNRRIQYSVVQVR